MEGRVTTLFYAFLLHIDTHTSTATLTNVLSVFLRQDRGSSGIQLKPGIWACSQRGILE